MTLTLSELKEQLEKRLTITLKELGADEPFLYGYTTSNETLVFSVSALKVVGYVRKLSEEIMLDPPISIIRYAKPCMEFDSVDEMIEFLAGEHAEDIRNSREST